MVTPMFSLPLLSRAVRYRSTTQRYDRNRDSVHAGSDGLWLEEVEFGVFVLPCCSPSDIELCLARSSVSC
jgi:hypothetical protein